MPLDVLVVNPPNHIFNTHTKRFETTDRELLMPPIDTLTHAAQIRSRGHNVEFYDMDVRDEGKDQLEERIARTNPDIVYMLFDEVVQLHSHTGVMNALKLLRMSRMMGAQGVISGIIPSYFYREVLEQGAADIVIRNQAAPILPLLFSQQETLDLTAPGIAYRDHGEIRETGPVPHFNISDYWVLPAFDLAEQERYPIEVRALATSRGCRPAGSGCTFCPYSNFWERYQAFTPAQTAAEIEHLLSTGYDRIMFIEHNFTLNTRRVRGILEEIKNRDLTFQWGILSRLDLDRRLLPEMQEAGLRWIHFGAESGDEETLRRLRKGITTETTRDTVAYAKSLGLRVRTSWIIDGGQTMESVDKTIELIDELRTEEIKPHFLSYRAYAEFGENGAARFDGQSIFCPSSEGDRPAFLRGYAHGKFNALCNHLESQGYHVTREEKAKEGFWKHVAATGSRFVALGPGRYGVGWEKENP